MTAEIVNLRHARKQKARAQKEALSSENRKRFGRSKAERSLEAAIKEQDVKKLEALRRQPTDPAAPGDDKQ